MAEECTILIFIENIVDGGEEVADPVTSWGDEVVYVHYSFSEVFGDDRHDSVESKSHENHKKLDDLLHDFRVTSHGAGETWVRGWGWDTEATVFDGHKD